MNSLRPSLGSRHPFREGLRVSAQECVRLALGAQAENLRIGARYMADQMRQFKDEIFVALAAYNAGPGAAQRWRDADGTDDADVYLETVEFAETRLYVEIVAENYAIYRYLYGGESKPNLP